MAKRPRHTSEHPERPWPPGMGDNQFGYPVPTAGQVAALDCAVEVMGCDPMIADPIIRHAAEYVALDEIDKALWTLESLVNLIGAYRLLAVMCCEGGQSAI